MDDQRPNPDELLEKVQREEARAARGHLKVFFGACAGVGKTYAMLAAAHGLRAQGTDVVVGVAETHGRNETARLLEGLEVIPARRIEYRGRTLPEFDLDAALAAGKTAAVFTVEGASFLEDDGAAEGRLDALARRRGRG